MKKGCFFEGFATLKKSCNKVANAELQLCCQWQQSCNSWFATLLRLQQSCNYGVATSAKVATKLQRTICNFEQSCNEITNPCSRLWLMFTYWCLRSHMVPYSPITSTTCAPTNAPPCPLTLRTDLPFDVRTATYKLYHRLQHITDAPILTDNFNDTFTYERTDLPTYFTHRSSHRCTHRHI